MVTTYQHEARRVRAFLFSAETALPTHLARDYSLLNQ